MISDKKLFTIFNETFNEETLDSITTLEFYEFYKRLSMAIIADNHKGEEFSATK